MFSTLKFSMLNSLGTRVVVRLFNNCGKIDYEILFPDIGASEAVRSSLSRADSDKFRRKLEKRGLLDQLRDIESNEPSADDTWSIEIGYGEDDVRRASGPDFTKAPDFIILEDLAEELDERFPILQLISSSRIDRLELEFSFYEHETEDSWDLEHTETVALDREDGTFSYSKDFPAKYFHCSFESTCELYVRSILDHCTRDLSDPRLLEDVFAHKEPMVLVCITYHDGSYVQINRGLSRKRLRDSFYFELLQNLFATFLEMTYSDGLFDMKFLSEPEEEQTA